MSFNHGSPVRFPTDPMSSSRLGLPSFSRVVACKYGPYVRCVLLSGNGILVVGRLVTIAAGASSDKTSPIPLCHSRASLSDVGHTMYWLGSSVFDVLVDDGFSECGL